LDYAVQTQANMVVHGGDFFFRSKVHPAIVDRAYQALCNFAGCGIPILIVPGNHERSVLPPSLFLHHPNIYLFDRPRTYWFEIDGNRFAISGFPYVRRIRDHFRQVFQDCESQRRSADHRLLCFHHAVAGAVVGPVGFKFGRGSDVISVNDLPDGFDLILSGHIHRHQVLSYATAVVYCGSIERTSFAERYEPKGFCELRFERGRQSPDIHFHELPTRPMVEFDGRGLDRRSLLASLEEVSVDWSPRAIVRLHLSDYPGSALRGDLVRHIPGILELSCR